MVKEKNLQLFVAPLNGTSEAKCSQCDKEFSDVMDLTRHIQLSHKSYPCPICGIIFPSYTKAKYHKIQAHTETKHKCPHCPKKCNNNNDFQRHLSICERRKIPCELCGRKFKSLLSAYIHNKKFHANKPLGKAQIDQNEQSLVDFSHRCEGTPSLVKNPLTAPSDTKCTHCKKEFLNVKLLSYHIKSCHEPTACNICGKLLSGRVSARYHKKTKHTEPNFKCANCPLTFFRKSQYQTHLPICVERKLPCKLCGQMLKHSASLKWHMRRVHHIEGDLSEVPVDDRRKSTPNQSPIAGCPDLSQHAEVQETLDPESSSKNANGQISPLAQDRRIGTHEEIDSPNAFTSSDQHHLDSRLIEHSPANSHNDSDTIMVTEKKSKMHPIASMKGRSESEATAENSMQPLVENLLSGSSECAHCGKECSSFFALTRHIEMIHVPNACDICGITFPSVVKARYHKITKHMKPKRKCLHCPKIFHTEKRYQIHLSYCGDKKFSCELCDQKFKASKYVVTHMRRVHKVKGELKKVLIDHKDSQKEDEEYQVAKTTVKEGTLVEGTTSNPFFIIDCSICGDNFEDQSQVSRHVEEIHQMTMCAVCEMTFTSADQLNDHKFNCHQHLKHVITQCSTEEIVQPHDKTSSSGLSDTVCPHCHKDFCHKVLLVRHIAWCHQPIECATCGVTISGKNRLGYHKMKYHSDLFKCPHCPKKFPLKANYLRHVSNHVKDSKLACKLCDHRYKNALALKDHMRQTHNSKEYQSDHTDCNKLTQELQPCDDANLLQGENMELKMEIQVEETMLQEQEYQAPDEDREKLPTIIACKNTIHNPHFKCLECDKPYHAQYALRKHMEVHSSAEENKHFLDGSEYRRTEVKGEKATLDDSARRGSKQKEKIKIYSSERRRSNRIRVKQ